MKKNKKDEREDCERVGIALSTLEVVNRGGSANAEYLKGYSGFDHETGQIFNRSLKDIAQYKLDPKGVEKTIKQQAGFSAEVLATSKDNAKALLEGSNVLTSRSEDLPQYGKNHNVVDRVKLQNGKVIAGTEAQMKFVGKPNELVDNIVAGKGKNDLSRYQNVKLELPSEQVASTKQYCIAKAGELRQQAERVEQSGKVDLAKQMRKNADVYEKVGANCEDSGITTDQAIFARTNPKSATALEMIKTSHTAATEAARYGAVIGGTVSIFKNCFALAQEKQEVSAAIVNIATDTTKAAALAYGTTYIGATAKGLMQQSSNATTRALSNTALPTLALSICISASGSISRYINGEIDGEALAEELGEQGVGMLSSSMMAAIGQIALPIPFVGAAVGGMIGYTLSSMFYQSALETSREAKASHENYLRVRAICEAARENVLAQKVELQSFMDKEFSELCHETHQLFVFMENHEQNPAAFTQAINQYAQLLGAQLEFKSMTEFENFMQTDQPFIL